MSDAIDVLIADLASGRYSDAPQEVRVPIVDFIAALQEIQGGLSPSGPEAANTVFAGPGSGAAALPTFRALVAADLGTGLNASFGSVNLTGATVPATGIYLPNANTIGFSAAGAQTFLLSATGFFGASSSSARVSNAAATSTVPTLIPNRTTLTTGFGAQASGNISAIVAAAEVARFVAGGIQLGAGIGGSAVLNDYEIGTWTPADASSGGLAFTNISANYTRIGNIVHAYGEATYPATADVSQAKIGGLPFTIANQNYASTSQNVGSGSGVALAGQTIKATTTFFLLTATTLGTVTNATLAGSAVLFNIVYPIA